MTDFNISGLTAENARLIKHRDAFNEKLRANPEIYWPFWYACRVDVLIVTDGNLDFSEADFGLATFVRSLLDIPGSYVRFNITLGHIDNAGPTRMMEGEDRIVRRIPNFKFDDPDHFAPDMYHEVMLFGILVSKFGRGTASDGQPYPTTRLADPELRALTLHTNSGRGLFATGDHGNLGRFLSSAVPRARNMRLWSSTSGNNDLDEVSMDGPRRNDTNRPGPSVGSQFNDQSDDVPQTIQPKVYSRKFGFFKYTFPHPLLCGPNGVIRVMPDHPHEGECVVPGDPDLDLNIDGPLGPEYPPVPTLRARPLPEVISTSTVLAGTTSSGKDPTISHSFGGICAYDGHRANIGRVVTDATWHHFVNINLVGDSAVSPLNAKHDGFLHSIVGQAHLNEIRSYYRNIAVWIAPPERIKCMNARLSWTLVWAHRVMEAVLSTPDIRLAETEPRILVLIGKHARDVLGNFAGQCQSVRLVLDLVIARVFPDIIPDIDPWLSDTIDPKDVPDGVDWFDGAPLLDMVFGAALVALREKFPEPDESIADKLTVDDVTDAMTEGGKLGVELAIKSASRAAELATQRLRR